MYTDLALQDVKGYPTVVSLLSLEACSPYAGVGDAQLQIQQDVARAVQLRLKKQWD